MKQTPLAAIKARFDIDETDPTKARKAAKSKLLAAVKKLADGDNWLDRGDDGKGLAHVSNKKLLRILDTLEAVKKAGGRKGLIEGLAAGEGRDKDKHFASRFENWSTPRLYDHYRASTKRTSN